VKQKLVIFLTLVSIFLAVAGISFLVAVGHTQEVYQSLKMQQLNRAAQHAQAALNIVKVWRVLSEGKIPDFVTWEKGLALVITTKQLVNLTPTYLQQALTTQPPAAQTFLLLSQNTQQFQQQLTTFTAELPHTLIIKKIIPAKTLVLLDQLQPAVLDLTKVMTHLSSGEHTFLVVFQNSDELRATGGFMGSYQRLKLNQGAVTDLQIEDIYQPAGQVITQRTPPAGVKEYLSSGKGWGLTDSNWNPDLPTSGPLILDFFQEGKEPAEGIILVNLSLAEQLLKMTGDISLPDQGVTVTSENLSSLARADRSQFFPGSRQKQHFLQGLFTQLKLRLTHLSPDQQLQLFQLLATAVKTKNIQVFSKNPTLHSLAQKYHLTGDVFAQPSSAAFLFPIESNVGINKANRLVAREYHLKTTAQMSEFTVHFLNHNPSQPDKEHPGVDGGNYINYQRLWLPLSTKIETIRLNDKTLSQWAEEEISLSSGQKIKEVGFLVPVAAGQEATVTVTFSHPNNLYDHSVEFPRQSGLAPIPLTITRSGQDQQLLLNPIQ
jgi:hypothetical protein